MENPWMHSVTLTLANTNYNLYTLMAVAEPNPPALVQRLQIQADPAGQAAEFRIGGAALSDTNYGVLIYATQAVIINDGGGQNTISTRGVYVRCNTAGLRIAITALQH
jgi:hypothetical protein